MATVGDVYQIIDEGTLQGQKVINVWFYSLSAEPLGFTGAVDAAQAYVDQVLPLITPLQSSEVVHTSVKAQNLFDVADAAEILVSVAGEYDGEELLGTFEAFPFKLVGDNAAVRNGSKRIAGVVEGVVVDGVVTNAPALANLADLADTMADALAFGMGVPFLSPIVVKRILDGLSYRLPENSGEAVISFVVDALFSALVTSQVSRKIGRGQ